MSDILKQIRVTIPDEFHKKRLDASLSALPQIVAENLSRSRLKDLIEQGHVTDTTGAPLTNPSKKVHTGQEIQISVPEAIDPIPEAENIPLEILYEDDAIIIINKSPDMVVHPAAGNPSGTLVNALLYHCGDSLSGIGGVKRPGIVHRLDKETSGLMVVAKTDQAHHFLQEQFADHSVSRTYYALCKGDVSPLSGTINAPIGRHPQNRQKMAVTSRGGKHAITHYKVQKKFGFPICATLLEIILETGRTHQIRVHLSDIGHGLIGDPVYGRQKQKSFKGLSENAQEAVRNFPRQALHAKKLRLIHPLTKQEMEFECNFPNDFNELLCELE